MRRSDDDLLGVPERELDRLSDDELLRLVVITRDGDRTLAAKAQAAWKTLVARDIERVRGIVAMFRFPGHPTVRVELHDVDMVAQNIYLRAVKMAFRGTIELEFRAAMRKCVFYECMDHCRRKMEEDMRRAGSLDEEIATDEGDGRPRFDEDIAKLDEQRIEDEQALERLAERRVAVDKAIAKVEDERKRRVLEMTRDGCPTEEIMAELGTSEANVYQLRRRALALVQRILDGDGEDDDGQG